MSNFPPQEGLVERIYWLIRLRWIAVAGVVFTVLFTEKLIRVSFEFPILYAIAAVLGAYNLGFFIYLNRIKNNNFPSPPIVVNRIANIQISLDLLSLTALIHFSGGVENPFIFYFIFHMIIAGILLSRRASYFQATLAASLYILTVGLEYGGFLGHYHIDGFLPHGLHINKVYILGVSFVFISTLYLAVYMATAISAKLRQKEKTLKQANLLLEEKDSIKSKYVLRVSHDIKEHLSAIQGCLEPVMEGITGELNPKQMDLIKRAVHRTGKLTFFVKALLEITRIKLSKHIEMDYFPISKTIESAVASMDARARDKGINLACRIDPASGMLKGAQIYIEEAIVNLLANSIKYTPVNGKIAVEVEDNGDSVLIRISDTGIGIPKDEISNIFDEFYRARNARQQEKDGTGLGLSISKEIIERHGGKIWAESEKNHGSVFSIILPVDKDIS